MRSPWNRERTGRENDGSVESSGAASPGGPAGLNTEEWDLLRAAPDYDAEEMSNVWPGEAWTPPGFLTETTLEEDGENVETRRRGDAESPLSARLRVPEFPRPSVGEAPRGGVPEMPVPSESAPAEVEHPPRRKDGACGGTLLDQGEGGDAGAWRPPNRIEPPARFQTPSGNGSEATPRGGYSKPAASDTGPVTAARSTPFHPSPQQQRGGYPAPPAADTVQQYPEARTLALLAEDLLGRPLDAPPSPPLGSGAPAPEPAAGPPQPEWTPAAPRTSRGGGDDLWDQVMPLWDETSSSSSSSSE